MSTTAQVRELVQPLVARNEDLTLVGRALVLEPVHHFVRGVYVDRTSSKGQIRPFWYVRLLFAPRATGWSNELPVYGCYVDDPQTRDIFARQVNKCLDELLRLTADIRSLWDLPKRASGRNELWPEQECLIVAAQGHFEQAEDVLSQHIADEEQRLRREREGIVVDHRPQSRPWQRALEQHHKEVEHLDQLRRLLDTLATRDKPAIGDLLRGWERQAAKTEGLDRIWQEMPFPFEA